MLHSRRGAYSFTVTRVLVYPDLATWHRQIIYDELRDIGHNPAGMWRFCLFRPVRNLKITVPVRVPQLSA
jgi:hypothetical protein